MSNKIILLLTYFKNNIKLFYEEIIIEYRVENGEITMPVSELNRLNDEAKKLKEEREYIEEMISENMVCETVKVFSINGSRSKSIDWFPINEEIKKLIKERDKIISYSDDFKNKLQKIENMTVKEFKKYKKSK